MTKNEVISEVAKSRLVEKTIEGLTHQELDFDLSDLSQMIYEALLNQPEERVVDLWNNNEMPYFIIGIVRNQAFSNTSKFYYTIKKFRAMTDDIDECFDIDDDGGEQYRKRIQDDMQGV